MIEAAMNRRYSASQAESFFTGGGLHRFQNFDAADNGPLLTVRDAFHQSVNLVFIRLMRDLVHYFMFGVRDAAPVLADSRHPNRRGYLTRFADREGREFLRRFYRRHRGVPADEALETLVARRPSTDARLAVLFRSTRPGAGPEAFGSFIQAHRAGAALPPADLGCPLTIGSDQARWTLSDRGYIASVHPLELWLLEYLRANPMADLPRCSPPAPGHVRRRIDGCSGAQTHGGRTGAFARSLESRHSTTFMPRGGATAIPSSPWCPRMRPPSAAPATTRRRSRGCSASS